MPHIGSLQQIGVGSYESPGYINTFLIANMKFSLDIQLKILDHQPNEAILNEVIWDFLSKENERQ